MTSLPEIRAETRRGTADDGSELELRVDPLALQALAAAREAGGSPGSYGALPQPDELPLMVVVIETRLDMFERRLDLVEDELERRRIGSDA
jgi:hypothetical protein